MNDCPVCYDPIISEIPLPCGHLIHKRCVQKHFRPECPLCRAPVNFEVYGEMPKTNIILDYSPECEDEYEEDFHIENLDFERAKLEGEENCDFLHIFLSSISETIRKELLETPSSPLYAFIPGK